MASTGLENLSDDELIAAFEKSSPTYKPAPIVPEVVSGMKDYYKSLHEPTEPATSVKDFTTRVIPESMGKTAVGMVEYPYHLAKSFTDPLLTNEPLSGMENALLSNAESIARGTGEPIGLYGLKALKERWLSDPVGSLLGVTPLVSSIKFKNINPVLREHVKTGKPISELIDIPRETIDTHIRKKSTEDLIRIVEQTKPKTIETEQNIGEYSPVLSNVQKEFKPQSETIDGVKPFKDAMQSRPQPEPALPPGDLFKEPKITGIPKTDTGISETDIARAKVINDEMSHPAEFIFGKESIEQPKGVIERAQGQGQATEEQVTPTEQRVSPEVQSEITALQPEASPAMAATLPATKEAWQMTEALNKLEPNNKTVNEKKVEATPPVTTPILSTGDVVKNQRFKKPLDVPRINLKTNSTKKYNQALQQYIDYVKNKFVKSYGGKIDEILDVIPGENYNITYKVRDVHTKEIRYHNTPLPLSDILVRYEEPLPATTPTIKESLKVESQTVGGLKEPDITHNNDPVTKQETKQILGNAGLDYSTKALKEQKTYLISEIDKAIELAPQEGINRERLKKDLATLKNHRENTNWLTDEQERKMIDSKIRRISDKLNSNAPETGYITIEVPGDGKFRIINSKQTLKEFKEIAQKNFPVRIDYKIKTPGKAVTTSSANKAVGLENVHVFTYKGKPAHSNLNVLLFTEPKIKPKNIIEKALTDKDVDYVIPKGVMYNVDDIKFESKDDLSETLSDKPLPEPGGKYIAIVSLKAGDKEALIPQTNYNYIKAHFPEATFKIPGDIDANIEIYNGKQLVGIVTPMSINEGWRVQR